MEERVPRTLRLAPDEWDQLPRLGQFRQRHPGVVIGAGEGWWQARIPKPNGEIVTTRYTLRALLDKLDELLTDPGGSASLPTGRAGCVVFNRHPAGTVLAIPVRTDRASSGQVRDTQAVAERVGRGGRYSSISASYRSADQSG